MDSHPVNILPKERSDEEERGKEIINFNLWIEHD
jgi:hypothetical protein